MQLCACSWMSLHSQNCKTLFLSISSQHLKIKPYAAASAELSLATKKDECCSSQRKSVTSVALKCDKQERQDEMSVGNALGSEKKTARRRCVHSRYLLLDHANNRQKEKTACAYNLLALLIFFSNLYPVSDCKQHINEIVLEYIFRIVPLNL